MNRIELKYFKSRLGESNYEIPNEGMNCIICGEISSPVMEVDESLNIVSTIVELPIQGETVCLKCLYERKYSFEQQVEGGYLTKNGILTESEKYPSRYSDSDILAKEKQLRNIEKSKIEELMHTPQFRAWQGAVWLVHCNDFMTFIGTWQHNDFVKHSPDGKAKEFYDQICDNGDDLYESQFGPEKSEYAGCTFYAFECLHCGTHRGYIDNA